jgi:hypothetical protein
MNVADIEQYLKKSGDTAISTDNLIKNAKGFMSWRVTKPETLVLINVYGDGKYWDSVAVELAKQLNLSKIVFGTKRNPKAFERKYGYSHVGYILEKEV